MKYDTLIFDLDGTLLVSLDDIIDAVNDALKDCGYSIRYNLDNGRKLIGSGALILATRAFAPVNGTNEEFDRFNDRFLYYYKAYQGRKTKPFDGLPEVLRSLKEEGIRLFVASNKPDHLLQIIIKETYGDGIFEAVSGQKPGYPVKPDPRLLNEIVEEYNLDKSKCLYVGDSRIDVEFAHNAGIESMLCKYGYDFYTDELLSLTDYSCESVNDLYEQVKGLN